MVMSTHYLTMCNVHKTSPQNQNYVKRGKTGKSAIISMHAEIGKNNEVSNNREIMTKIVIIVFKFKIYLINVSAFKLSSPIIYRISSSPKPRQNYYIDFLPNG